MEKEQVRLTNTEDLQHCESEDLVHKETIQSYGSAIVIDESTKEILFMSQNINEMLNDYSINIGSIPKIIGIQGEDLLTEILEKAKEGHPAFIGYANISETNYSLEVLVHKSVANSKHIIIEFVPYSPKNTSNDAALNSMLIHQLSYLINDFNASRSLNSFIEEAAGLVQKFLAYDRVIFYKFNKDWSGEVLSEAVANGLEQKYLGLHFPSSDIPSQARELFKKNPVRVIADVNSTHIPIIGKSNEEMYDQTYSTLRTSSEFHLDYLRNMGSKATLTVSILVNNKLWGMLSCHHSEPKIPPFNHRQSILSIITIIAHVFSNQLQSKIEIEQLQNLNNFIKHLEDFRRQSNMHANFDAILKSLSLLVKEHFQSDGIAIFIEDKVFNDTLNDKSIQIIKNKLLKNNDHSSFESIDDVEDLDDIFLEENMVGGFFFPFKKLHKGGVFLSKKEWNHTVNWAGRPDIYSKVQTKEGKTVLGVRNSFEVWQQEVRRKSKPWDEFIPKLCEELENTVTVLHTIDQLNYAMEKAEESTRTKAQFLANMSHEIRTPLNGIIGLTNLVLNEELEDSQRTYLEQVIKSSELLLHVLNDILDYSKIDAGRLEIECKEFEHHKAIRNTLDIFEHALTQNRNILKVNIHKEIPLNLKGDIFRFKQVLNNLLGNAVKFTTDGIISLNVNKGTETNSHLQVIYEVSDTGIGMTEQTLEKLFGSFMQSDVSHSRKYGGTGLGLAISKLLVELMGGEISVKSQYGVGSTFKFTINYLKVGVGEKGISDASDEKVLIQNHHRLLVVEDDIVNQMVIEGYLKLFGISYHLATNGEEAIELAKKYDYSLILMDIQMPVKNGYEAAIEIRKFNKDVPIIALSAAVMQTDKDKTTQAGMNGHLAKPFKEDGLIKCINEYLDLS